MKKTLYWLALNGGLAAALWFGFWQGVEGARYLAQFYVFAFAVPMGLIAQADGFQKRMAEDAPRPVTRSISAVIGWCALATFIWHGYIVTACAWALWMLLAAVARVGAQKHRSSAATA